MYQQRFPEQNTGGNQRFWENVAVRGASTFRLIASELTTLLRPSKPLRGGYIRQVFLRRFFSNTCNATTKYITVSFINPVPFRPADRPMPAFGRLLMFRTHLPTDFRPTRKSPCWRRPARTTGLPATKICPRWRQMWGYPLVWKPCRIEAPRSASRLVAWRGASPVSRSPLLLRTYS